MRKLLPLIDLSAPRLRQYNTSHGDDNDRRQQIPRSGKRRVLSRPQLLHEVGSNGVGRSCRASKGRISNLAMGAAYSYFAAAFLALFALVASAHALTPAQKRVLYQQDSDAACDNLIASAGPTYWLESPDPQWEMRENRLLQSENLAASWTPARSAVIDASTFKEDGTAGDNHHIKQTIAVTNGVTYRIGVDLKAKDRHAAAFYAEGALQNKFAYFNLDTCAVASVQSPMSATGSTTADGWCHYEMTIAATSSANSDSRFYICTAADAAHCVYDGDNSSAIYMRRAYHQDAALPNRYQATTTAAILGLSPTQTIGSWYSKLGTLAPMVQGTASNRPIRSIADSREQRLLQSSAMLTTPWEVPAFHATATQPGVANPLTGAIDAWLLTEAADTQEHRILQHNISVTAGNAYVLDGYAKANGRSIAIRTLGGITDQYCYFDLSAGVARGCSSTGITQGISAIGGNSWYYISLTFTATSTSADAYYIFNLSSDPTNKVNNYAGDGSKGAYIYAPSFRSASALPTYIATTTYPIYRGQNGRAGAYFGGSHWMTSGIPLSSVVSASEETIFAVVRSPISGEDIISTDGSLQLLFGHGTKPYYLMNDGGTKQANGPTITLGKPHVLMGIHKGGYITMCADGVCGTPVAAGDRTTMTGKLAIGRRDYSTSTYFTGDMQVPALIYPKGLPQSTYKGITRCLCKRYGAGC